MDKVKLFDRITPLIFDYLRRFVYYLVHDEDLAKDIMQETLIQIWKHLDQLQDEEKVRAWVRTIAIRTAMKALNKRRRFRNIFMSVRDEDLDYLHGTTGSAEDTALQQMDVYEAKVFVDSLDVKTKQIFVLHGEYEMTFKEIGQYMNMPQETVKTKYYRALDRYRKHKGR